MSHGSAGIETQALLTVFAANFVRWAVQWVRKRVEHSTKRFEMTLGSPKRLSGWQPTVRPSLSVGRAARRYASAR